MLKKSAAALLPVCISGIIPDRSSQQEFLSRQSRKQAKTRLTVPEITKNSLKSASSVKKTGKNMTDALKISKDEKTFFSFGGGIVHDAVCRGKQYH